jgi:hypothetical protein
MHRFESVAHGMLFLVAVAALVLGLQVGAPSPTLPIPDAIELPLPPVEDVVQPASEPASPRFVDPITKVGSSKPAILMVTVPGCRHCVEWWAREPARYEASGWHVEKVENKPEWGFTRFPTYRIYTRGRWVTHVGPLTDDAVRSIQGVARPKSS